MEVREASFYEIISRLKKKKRPTEKNREVSYYNNLKFHLKSFLRIYSNIIYNEWKWKLSCLTLCDPMDYTVYGIL